MRRALRRLWSQQSGYTLVELVVAMSIFAVVLIAAVASFVSVSNLSAKSVAQRKVQQDARFSLEDIARQTRSSEINYAFYAANGSNQCQLSNRTVLALLYTQDAQTIRQVFYSYDSSTKAIYRFETDDISTIPCNTIITPSNDRKVTANNVEVSEMKFYVSPTGNPYDKAQNDQSIKNTHPRVTMMMTVKTPGTPANVNQQSRAGTVTIQTSISSRAYPQVVALGDNNSNTPLPSGPIAGLKGEYYQGNNFNTFVPAPGAVPYYVDQVIGTPLTWPSANFLPLLRQRTNQNPVQFASVRWTGQFNADVAATYTFCGTSDDGNRIYVNGNQLTNDWGIAHTAQTSCGSRALTPGWHTFVVEYSQGWSGGEGQAEIKVEYERPGVPRQEIPTSKLRFQP